MLSFYIVLYFQVILSTVLWTVVCRPSDEHWDSHGARYSNGTTRWGFWLPLFVDPFPDPPNSSFVDKNERFEHQLVSENALPERQALICWLQKPCWQKSHLYAMFVRTSISEEAFHLPLSFRDLFTTGFHTHRVDTCMSAHTRHISSIVLDALPAILFFGVRRSWSFIVGNDDDW